MFFNQDLYGSGPEACDLFFKMARSLDYGLWPSKILAIKLRANFYLKLRPNLTKLSLIEHF